MRERREVVVPLRAALARLRAGARGVRVRARLAGDDDGPAIRDASAVVPIAKAAPAGAGDLVEGTLVTDGGELRLVEIDIVARWRAAPLGSDTRLSDKLTILARRDALVRSIRAYFHGAGFVEVPTPVRVACPGLEPHLVPIAADRDLWLRTSPELHLKRLVASGLERVFEIGPVFRGDERGAHHLGEFTMLEWYRAGESLETLVRDLRRLLPRVARAAGVDPARIPGCDLTLPFERLTIADAFVRHAGFDPFDVTLDEKGLDAEARRLGAPADPGESRAELTARLFVHAVEGRLGRGRATVLGGYPASEAAMARVTPGPGGGIARRFELYAGGFELANAFDELTDPDEQRARFDEWRAVRERSGGATPSVDRRFLAALDSGHPPAVGIALGVDRLFALIVGAGDLRETLPFPDEV